MKTNWTEQQQKTILADNPTLLISAAAGSGKTAVLIERIMRLLLEGVSIDRMLIVTFTRAAAVEMMQRLYKRLCEEIQGEHPELSRQLDLLPQAQISTIHTFCMRVLKTEFQQVGIDPMARMADQNTQTELFRKAEMDALNELLEENNDADFLLFARSFSQQKVFDMIDRLHQFIMALPYPFEWMHEQTQNLVTDFNEDHPWVNVLVKQAETELMGLSYEWQIEAAMMAENDAIEKTGKTVEADGKVIEQIRMELQEGLSVFEIVGGIAFPRAAATKATTTAEDEWKERFKKVRGKMTDHLKSIRESLTFDEEQACKELHQMKHLLCGMEAMMIRTHAKYQEAKGEKNLLDFNDLEQMTLAVLDHEESCETIRREYDHIFVDECQDLSAIQDAILQKLHDGENKLFMVGDVKQSIYRFRQADPTLFLERMRSFSQEENGEERRISLQMNFRSDANILEGSNQVFRALMRKDAVEIEYEKDDELIPPPAKPSGRQVEVMLFDKKLQEEENDSDEVLTELAVEAEFTAKRINELHESDGFVYRDMVILMPKVKNASAVVNEKLTLRGIPVYCDEKTSYYDLPEISVMVNFLQIMDNPMQDLPMLTVLKMPNFDVSDEELAALRMMKRGKTSLYYEAIVEKAEQDDDLGQKMFHVKQCLEQWRFELSTMKLSAFVWKIMQETGLYALMGSFSHGDARQANLRLFCQRVLEYEENSDGSLQGFLVWQKEMRAGGDSTAAVLLGDGEDLVRIMTIHKSKGLQFPVVFVLGLGSKMMVKNTMGLRCHRKLGLCLPYVNKKLHITRNTFGAEAFGIVEKMEQQAEKARLLYVAMTRAENKLILVGECSEKSRSMWYYPPSTYRIGAADSMMDWIMQALTDDENIRETMQNSMCFSGNAAEAEQGISTTHPQASNLWNIRVSGFSPQETVEKNKVINSLFTHAEQWISTSSVEKPGKLWKREEKKETMQPIKTSVSAIVKQELLHETELQEEETEEDKRKSEDIVTPLRMESLQSEPNFLSKKTVSGSKRGSILHKALSLVDLDKLRAAPEALRCAEIEKQRAEWIANNQIEQEEAAFVKAEMIEAFFESELGRRILASSEVHREWSFNLRLRSDQRTLMQGIMDCAFLEGDEWVLVDYKTDRIEDEEAFTKRYAMQLALYAQGLQDITGKRVKEKWLYSLSKSKSYEIK